MKGPEGDLPGQQSLRDDMQALRAAIAALESQRATLGDAVLELAVAPLRERLAGLLRPAGVQRRQVAVLFADVVGSTAMTSGRQPEDALNLLDGALRRMADIVQAHQGRVLRFTGDGVKAAFGMDEAREDDAERAVRAGLAMLAAGREQAQALRQLCGIPDFAVRVGVHTGDVALGAGVEADNTAMGAAVHIAARMEQSAPPGTLRISGEAWSHVRGLFDVEPQPPLQVKGIAEPMKTYLVHAARQRSVASVERGLQGLRTPMVGRRAELQRLRDAVPRPGERGPMRALTLLGDAGLGKSRLLRELTASLGDCRVLAVRSQPDGALRPWGLLRSLLATQFGVADTDSAEVARRKVEDGLSPWFAERGPQQAQLIGQLSGLDFGDSPHLRGLDPRSLRDQAFAALRGYLQALAARGPLLLLVEDLHWADDGSLDLLQHLLAHAAELPLALIMTSRPALLQRRADWATPETTVTLEPLAAAQRDQLAQALLQRLRDVPPPLTELIVGRAEGNPYYMEELVRRLIDDGVIDTRELQWTVQAERLDTVKLPGTLVGLLQARLDALPPGQRQAARQASVIGHVFWDDALQALDHHAPQSLPGLQRAAFVRANATSDFEGTPQRQFDHHLLHQVTYDTLLKAERRLGHGAAARWLAARTQGRGAEFLAMTGEHAERAGETALAIDCFEQAAVQAQRRFANTAAVAWLRRAMGLLDESQPMRRLDLLDQLEKIADTVGDRAGQEALHREAAALLEQHPDDARQARLWSAMALRADRIPDTQASERLSRQAFELAERCGAAETAAMSQGNLAYQQFARGDQHRAASHLEIALQWAGRIQGGQLRIETEAKLLTVSAMVAKELCRFDEARKTFLDVLSRGEALALPRLQLGAIDNLANVAGDLGRWEEKRGWAERMRALAEAIGALPRAMMAHYHLAVASAELGEHEAAIRWAELAVANARITGGRPWEVAALQTLGGVHLQRQDAAAALQCHTQAQALFMALGDLPGECEAAADTAVCELRLGQPKVALEGVNRVLERLGGEVAGCAPHLTIHARWACRQVLEALGDARAAPMLDRLHADMRARAAELTDEADRERLIQALRVFRDIAAAHRRPSAPG